jgi:hypothetical protein
MDSQHNYKVFIVILNWNNCEDTSESLSSIKKISYTNYKIVLVDNGSTDNSVQRLKSEYPFIDIIINKENLGFAAGCNVGIRYSLEQGADCILLLNNDAVIEQNSLSVAVKTLFSDKRVGIVGGKIKQYYNPSYIDTTGIKHIIWPAMFMKSVGAGKLDKGQFNSRDVRIAVSGALMLIKREVFEKVGLLPEEFFFGVEDVDFCLTARKNGFLVIYEPCFIAYHKGNRSTKKGPQNIYSYFLHRQLLMKRHMNYFLWKISRASLFIYMRFYFYYKYTKNNKLDFESKNRIKEAILLAFNKGNSIEKVTKSDLALTLNNFYKERK